MVHYERGIPKSVAGSRGTAWGRAVAWVCSPERDAGWSTCGTWKKGVLVRGRWPPVRGIACFRGPCREQGWGINHSPLLPHPLISCWAPIGWIQPKPEPKGTHACGLPGRERWKWIWRDKFICFIKDFYPNIWILKYCLCQLYHFLRPFYLNSIDASILFSSVELSLNHLIEF